MTKPIKGPRTARSRTAPIIPNANFTFAQGAGSLSRSINENSIADARDIQLNVSGRDEPVALILGRNQLGAKLTRPLNYGGRMLFPVLWGRGTVDAIESLTLGLQPMPAEVLVTNYTGSQTTADPKLVSAFAAIGVTWTAALTGIAYSVLDFPIQGVDIGEVHAIIRGLRAYDPRNGSHVFANPATWSYTTNPVLLTARVMTDGDFGLSVTPDSDFWASVTTAANKCDEIVSGTTKRRTLNTVLQIAIDAPEAIKQLGQYCGCWIVPEGASYRFILDAPASSVATITASDILQGSFSFEGKDTLARPNIVFVRYTEPTTSGLWVSRLAPRGADIPAVPAGETYRAVTIERPGINSYQEALRAAQEYRGHEYLEDVSFRWRQKAEALRYQVADVVNLTYDVFTAKPVRIMSLQLASPDRWDVGAQEYDPAAYSNSFVTSPTYPDSGLPSPNAPPAVTGLTLSETVLASAPGSLSLSRINATATAVAWPFVSGYRWTVTNANGDLIEDAFTTSNVYGSPAVLPFTEYTVTVRIVSTASVQSSPLAKSIILVGLGGESLAAIYNAPVPNTGWALQNVKVVKHWEGDTVYRLRAFPSDQSLARREVDVYGTNIPYGSASPQLYDVETYVRFPGIGLDEAGIATSPVFDFGVTRSGQVALLNVATWVRQYGLRMSRIEFAVSDTNPPTNWQNALVLDTGSGEYILNAQTRTGRYARFRIVGKSEIGNASFPDIGQHWYASFENVSLAVVAPTVRDPVLATSSASGAVTVQLPRKYISITDVQITAQSSTPATASYSSLSTSESVLENNKLDLHVYNNSGARVAVPVSIQITGVPA